MRTECGGDLFCITVDRECIGEPVAAWKSDVYTQPVREPDHDGLESDPQAYLFVLNPWSSAGRLVTPARVVKRSASVGRGSRIHLSASRRPARRTR